jgi:hypothetical protein
MATTYTAAFGYQVYLVPVATSAVDLADVTGGIGSSGFINPTTLVAANAVLAKGTTPNRIMLGATTPANIVFDGAAVTAESVFKLTGLNNAALETDTSSETVQTYDIETQGFDIQVPVSKSWNISLAGVTKYSDSGYKLIRLVEAASVSGGLKVKIGRVGPVGSTEAVYGYATLTGFSETVDAGSIVTWEIQAEGFGPYGLDLDDA